MSPNIIFELTELKNYKEKIIENKDKFTSKTIILEYDENSNQYHILSCKYNYSTEDIIKEKYTQMLDSFSIYNLEYNQNDFNESIYAEITNFNDISSIYTKNGTEIYKKTFELLIFKDDKVFIEEGDFPLTDKLFLTEFSNIQNTENEISCTVTSTLFKSFDYELTIQDLDPKPFVTNFKLIKENDEWKIDEFNIKFE